MSIKIISKMKKIFLLKTVFWIFIANFVIIISGTFLGKWLRGPCFIPAIASFCLLGAVLLFLTIKIKVKGLLKKFLILAGGSAILFFISVILHNFLYGLGIITSHIIPLKYLFEILHISFFLIAVFLCPIGFLIGAIGSTVLFVKKKK